MRPIELLDDDFDGDPVVDLRGAEPRIRAVVEETAHRRGRRARPTRPQPPPARRVRPPSRVDVQIFERLRNAVAGAQAAGGDLRMEHALDSGCRAIAEYLEHRYNGGAPFPRREEPLRPGRGKQPKQKGTA